MSIENPKDPSLEQAGLAQTEASGVPSEAEMTEDQKQTALENANRERFVQDWVMSSSLAPEQKVFVADYIKTKPGAWREYNGVDFKVVEQSVQGDVWKVSFGVFFDDYEAQRIDVEIPISG